MKTTANIATFPPREQFLKIVIHNALEQFDEVRVCLNQYQSIPKWMPKEVVAVIPKKDLTDNGKFLFLKPNEIYCTLDDDIIYPKLYRQAMEANVILNNNAISTYHGRILTSFSNRYYTANHKVYHLLNEVKTPVMLHVCGTGVSAFDTSVFMPTNIAFHPLQKMTDILLSLEAAKQGVPIICQPHKANWFEILNVPKTIYEEKKHNDRIQAALCNRLLETKKPLG